MRPLTVRPGRAVGTSPLVWVLMLITLIAASSAMLVTNALPAIIADLRGSQGEFTLVVSATLIASVASTPVWGGLADIRDKKLLLQAAICVFTIGSMLCGLAPSVPLLIGFRGVQGVGLGGIVALTQVVMAGAIAPRQRGRYFGYIAVAQAVATIAGPLVGGLIVDSPLGWRWIFYIVVPFALIALVLVRNLIRLPDDHRTVEIDYLGAVSVSCAAGLLLVWIAMAGASFPWISWTSGVLVGAAALATLTTVLVESNASNPIIPFPIAADRTIGLLTVASVALGVCGFSMTVFTVQYLIVGRSFSASEAGLLTTPAMVCILVSTTVSGRLITRHGCWQRVLVLGAALNLVAFLLMSSIDHNTNFLLVEAGLIMNAAGFGMMIQTVVLGAQNAVPYERVGAATGIVSSARFLGGAVGLSVIGTVIGARTATSVTGDSRMAGSDYQWSRDDFDFSTMPSGLAEVVRQAFSDAVSSGMRVGAVMALVGLVAVTLIHETPLRASVAGTDPEEALLSDPET